MPFLPFFPVLMPIRKENLPQILTIAISLILFGRQSYHWALCLYHVTATGPSSNRKCIGSLCQLLGTWVSTDTATVLACCLSAAQRGSVNVIMAEGKALNQSIHIIFNTLNTELKSISTFILKTDDTNTRGRGKTHTQQIDCWENILKI